MATIIVPTDFSRAGYNALKYACAFTEKSEKLEMLLINIFTMPASYSGEGVSLAAIPESIYESENKLKESFEDILEDFPGIRIRTREVVGDFLDTLEDEIESEAAVMVIMGTPEDYGEMRLWSSDMLAALTRLSVPVLTVPANVQFRPIRKIALAVIIDHITSDDSPMMSAVKKLLHYTGAKLHVVNVVTHNEPGTGAENPFTTQLEAVEMQFYQMHEKDIVGTIGNFVSTHAIDLLLVRPRKHGIWYNLFHKSFSKELAKLSQIPVMALKGRWDIN